MPSSYKLTYWDFRGRAELIRLMFVVADKPFEDIRLKNRDQWNILKPTTKWGQVPLLEIDGSRTLTQTYSIARYLAKEFGLCGKDNWENAQIDEIAGHMDDFYSSLRPWINEQDTEKKKEIKAKVDATVHPLLSKIEATIKENKSGWIIGDQMTWIDLEISERTYFYKTENPQLIQGLNGLVNHMEKVHNHPKLKAYIERRKTS